MIFYVLFIGYSDFGKFYSSIIHFKFEFLPIIFLLSTLSMIIKGLRQHVLFKKIGIHLSLKNNMLLYFAGLSMIITPGSGGEVIKSYFLKIKHGHNMSKTFPIIFIERYHDVVATITILGFFLFFQNFREVTILVIVISSILIISYIAIRVRSLFKFITTMLLKIPKIHRFIDSIRESYEGFYALTSRKIMIQSWLLSLLAWTIDMFTIYFIFIAFNTHFNIIFTTLTTYSSVLFGAVSFLPAGIGITELSLVSLLTKVGVELSTISSIIIIIRLVGTWYPTIIGFITMRLFLSKKEG